MWRSAHRELPNASVKNRYPVAVRRSSTSWAERNSGRVRHPVFLSPSVSWNSACGLSSCRTQVDWIGAVMFIASLTAFLIGSTWGGSQFAWDGWHTLIPIIVGVVGIGASLLWERLVPRRPFFNLSLFCSTGQVIAYVCACLQGAQVSSTHIARDPDTD